ncbi:MAG TPA: hypothetical protein VGS19_00120 [Streptosporangiaceae bacterium]|nr:hypothetical protein [Streptosporangiaceae bacterium]
MSYYSASSAAALTRMAGPDPDLAMDHRLRWLAAASRDVVGQDWPGYMRQVCEILWPSPAVVTVEQRNSWRQPMAGRGSRSVDSVQDSEFVLVPGVRRVPLMVPADRRIAAAAVRHYSSPLSPVARLVAHAVSAGLASGLGASALRTRVRVQAPAGTASIETYLAEAVSREVRVSMFLGPARANRKPVLQVLGSDGRPIGFAKIGVNPLTRDLVRAECSSLARLSRTTLEEITAPPMLHYGEWRGLSVLLLSALPAWQRRHPVSAARLVTAMQELACVDGLERATLLDGPYLRHLRDRLAKADEGPERATLEGVLDVLVGHAGDTVFTYGAWHGDWAPWNMMNAGRRLLLWDWERFTTGVPYGFDALHHWLQTEIGPKRHAPLAAASACPDRAPQLLAPFRIPAPQARLTALLYLADLATRYLVDRQAESGSRSGAPGTWLIPALAQQVTRL